MKNSREKIVTIKEVDWQSTDSHKIKGCFSKASFKKGQIVFKFNPRYTKKRTRTSIQVGNLHIEDDIGQYLNHNCSPNTCVVNENDPKLIAINDISIGDELTFDYNSSEDEIHYVFKCNCHGKEIVGKLGSSLDSID